MGPASYAAPADKKEFRELLQRDSESLERIADVTNSDSCPHWLYGMVINFLTGLEVSEDESRQHYFKILEHKYGLSEKLQRDIGFRVAALDYFFNCNRLLHNPKFVEIDFFEKILALSKEDTKLGCYNMNYFAGAVNNEIKRADRYGQNLSLILIDIDDFKGINDRHGHLFGDKILEKFVGVIKSNLRSEDVLARYGGDEFIILLPQTGRIGARTMAERIRHRLIEYFKSKEYLHSKVAVRFSAGISTFPCDAGEYEPLVECADKALYKSKFLGKNMIYDFLESERGEGAVAGDKRLSARYRVQNENAVDIVSEASQVGFDGRILNISANGAFIECRCTLPSNLVAMPMNIVLKKLGSKAFSGMRIRGNIVRINNETRALKYYLALKFESMLNSAQWHSIERSADLVPL
jgi:diguanylate cyclase (GGDEF)-like protein